VNKTDLINQLAERLDGDKKAAQAAVEGFIDLVQREVQKGRNVSISGFGVFEKRLRAARTARNPRTGEAVKVKKTTVPAFRPGKYFKDVIAGSVKLPKPTGKPTSARAAAAAAGLQVVGELEFGLDYAETLRRWRERFLAEDNAVRKLGFDTRFVRIWEFYLAYCEAAFATGNTSVVQFTLQRD